MESKYVFQIYQVPLAIPICFSGTSLHGILLIELIEKVSEPEGPDWALASEGPLVDRPVFGYAPAGNLPQSRLIQSFGVEKDFGIVTFCPEAGAPPNPPKTTNANTASTHMEATPNTEAGIRRIYQPHSNVSCKPASSRIS
jgi:hypothetical protein